MFSSCLSPHSFIVPYQGSWFVPFNIRVLENCPLYMSKILKETFYFWIVFFIDFERNLGIELLSEATLADTSMDGLKGHHRNR